MTNTNETMNTTVNTEMAEVANEAVKMAKIDMITVAEIGFAAGLLGAAIYGGKKLWNKKIAPKFKKNKKEEEVKTEE